MSEEPREATPEQIPNLEIKNPKIKPKSHKNEKKKRKIIKKGNFRFNLKRGDWQCSNQACQNLNMSKR